MFSCIIHGWNSHDSSCPECHKTVTSATTNITIGDEPLEPEIPVDIVKQLREANPNEDHPGDKRNQSAYYSWDECCDKLEELLKQNQSK